MVPTNKTLLLDTTVSIDRLKSRNRRRHIDLIASDYVACLVTGISLLEFKAVYLEALLLIHARLSRPNANFEDERFLLVEKLHPQSKLRAHLLFELQSKFARPNASGIVDQVRLAEKVKFYLQQAIPAAYRAFRTRQGVDFVNQARIGCPRAEEEPRFKQRRFAENLPTCRANINRWCVVEEYICQHADRLITGLRDHLQNSPPESPAEGEQLTNALGILERVRSHPERRLSHQDCRKLGDCLIALEGIGLANDVLTTNKKDWEPLCRLLGYNFVHLTYPDENRS